MGPREALRRRRFAASVRREVRPERFAAYGAGALVHPPLTVSAPERVRVGASSLVLGGASLLLGPEGSLTIGARTYLGRDLTVICLGEVRIGDDVMSSDRLFLADTAPLPLGAGEAIGERALADARPVVVEDGAFLGMGAMVLAGVTVGARAVVGAGAVVTRDVPPNAVVVGNPARVVRRLDPGSGAWVPSGSEG